MFAATTSTNPAPVLDLSEATCWSYAPFAAGTVYDVIDGAPGTGVRMPPGQPLEVWIQFPAQLEPAALTLRAGVRAHVEVTLYGADACGQRCAVPLWSALQTDCPRATNLVVVVSEPITCQWVHVRLDAAREADGAALHDVWIHGARGATNLAMWPTRAFAEAEARVHSGARGALDAITRGLTPAALNAPARDGYAAGFFWYLLYARALEEAQRVVEAASAAAWAQSYAPYRTNVTDILPLAELYCLQGRVQRAIGWEFDAELYFAAAQELGVSNAAVWEECAVALAGLALEAGEFARAERFLRDLFVRVEQPSRAAYGMYAKTLFYNGRPRDGFDTLHECMRLYPLDAALVEKDPVFALYVDRIGEATEQEVCAFFDALGGQLELIEPSEHNQAALALCANQRTVLVRVFPFLRKEDDVARLRAAIEAHAARRRRRRDE